MLPLGSGCGFLLLIFEGVGHRCCILITLHTPAVNSRGFVACEKHNSCRLYTFVKNHGSRRRTAAYLIAWQMRAAPHRTAQSHISDKPSTEQGDAVMLRIAV